VPEKIGLEGTLDMADFNRGLKQYLAGIDKMETTTAKKGGAMSTVLGGIGKIAAGVMAAGVAVGAAAIAGVGAIIKSTLPLAADFQAQLVGLELAARQSGLAFDELHDVALQVGGDTRLLGVSATGAADAMTGLFKAGLSATEIFGDVNAYMKEGAELGGALRAAIDLAAATELDMVQASDLAAISLATFGGELETAEERANFVAFAMDNLVRSADASVAEVSDLASALTMVGPGAVALGYSIEDVNTALAILSTAGITGTRAGTALDGMLRTLLSPGKEAADTIAALGIELYDLDGSFRALPDIIGQFSSALTVGGQTSKKVSLLTTDQRKELTKLQKQHATATKQLGEYHKGLRGTTQTEETRLKAMAKLEEQINILNIDMGPLTDKAEQYTTVTREMTEAQRNQAIGTIFTAQGQRAMNVLLGEGVEGWEAMTEATAAATGIQEQAAARAETFTGRIEALQGQIETLKIGIGEAFMPGAGSLLEVLSKFIEEEGPKFTAWLEQTLPRAIETADEFLEGLGLDLIEVTKVWDEETGKWVTEIEAVEDPLKRLHDFIDVAMKEAMAGLAIAGTVAFLALSGPAIAAAAAIIVAWAPIIAIGAVIGGLIFLMKKYSKEIETAGIMIGNVLRDMEKDWKEHWTEVVTANEEFAAKLPGFFGEIGIMFEEFGAGFIAFWGETWDTISTKASEIWVTIKTVVGKGLADTVAAIESYVGAFIQAGKDLVGGIVTGIKERAIGIINAIVTAVNAAIRAARLAIAGFSPSRVFMDIGASMMEGLALGVAKTAAIPVAVTSEVMHRVSAPALFQRPAMTMPATSSSTVNVNMGGVSIYDQMSEAVFEAQVRQIVTSAVGG